MKLEVTMGANDLLSITNSADGVVGWFGLANDINLTNMMLYSPDKRIAKYNSALEISRLHFTIRLDF